MSATPLLLGALPIGVVETRVILGGVSTTGRVIFYLLALVTVAVFFTGWWKRLQKYSKGRPAGRSWWTRPARPAAVRGINATPTLSSAVGRLATNKPIRRRKPKVGGAHLLVFWGFIGLFVATTILSLDYDILGNISPLLVGHVVSFFHGPFYLAYNLIFNAAGVAAIVGTVLLIVRRARTTEVALDYTRAEKPASGYSRAQFIRGDWLFVGLLLYILVTGFVVQGLRIDAEGFPAFERWTWMGWLTGALMSSLGLRPAAAATAHSILWWAHSLAALAFVAYVPYSKAMHMFTSGASLVATDPSTTRNLPKPVSTADHTGYQELEDFSWKELLDFDACTKCGRCHEVCPARTAGAPLSPRDLILDLRQWANGQASMPSVWDSEVRPEPTGPLALNGSAQLVGDVVKDLTLWSCTTCMACVEVCPVGIEHVPVIIQMRRRLVDEGRMDGTLQKSLQNIAQQGNSFGKSSRMRARWTKALDFTIKDARKEPVEHLWFVGDYASFDDRLQRLSQTLARILNDAGTNFGILYDGERNSGNDVRRVGEEGLFEMLVEHNMGALGGAQYDDIFTTDPHSFNTLRNEYPEYGLSKPVKHYSELLADLLESGVIPVRPLGLKVTYHDPCYLGRYNKVTDAPRRVLAALGCEVVEMPRNRDNTFCCGAGGGRIWMDDSHLKERPSENRIREAVQLDVGSFIVACPKDFTMYNDAAKTTGNEQLKVRDLVELVDEAFERPEATTLAGTTTP